MDRPVSLNVLLYFLRSARLDRLPQMNENNGFSHPLLLVFMESAFEMLQARTGTENILSNSSRSPGSENPMKQAGEGIFGKLGDLLFGSLGSGRHSSLHLQRLYILCQTIY